MTAETDRSWQGAEAITGVERVKRVLRAVFARLRRPVRWLFEHSPFSYGFSSLSRRIVVLNLIGLAILVSGILYLNQFRAGLIDAKVQSLLTQGEIIAGALAASAGVDTDQVQLDPETLLEVETSQSPCRQRGPVRRAWLQHRSRARRTDLAPAHQADRQPRPHL